MKGLEVILEDFSDIISKAHEYSDKHPDVPPIRFRDGEDVTTVGYFWNPLVVHRNGMVWFGERADYEGNFVGTHDDYLSIRDNPEELEHFLLRLLDKGITSLGRDHETDIADYAIWMYRNSSHQPFKQSFENAVVSLLEYELSLTSALLSEDDPRTKTHEAIEARFGSLGEYLDIMFKRHDPKDIARSLSPGYTDDASELRDKLQPEIGKVTRTTSDGISEFHYLELPSDLRTELEDIHLDILTSGGVKLYPDQYLARTMGLLTIVGRAGTTENGFKAAKDVLLKAFDDGLAKDLKDFNFYTTRENLYGAMIKGLNALQEGNEFLDRWLSGIENDPNSDRVTDYVDAILQLRKTISPMFGSHAERSVQREQIPVILGALGKRGYSNVEELGRITNSMTGYPHRRYNEARNFYDVPKHRLDVVANILYVFDQVDVSQPGEIAFDILAYSPEGVRQLQARYSLEDNSYEGHPDTQDYTLDILHRAIPLPLGEEFRGISAREIQGSDTKVIQGNGHNLDGWIEGIMGLRFDVPFLYNSSTKELLIGQDMNHNVRKSDKSGEWFGLRFDLDSVEGVPYETLRPLEQMTMVDIRPSIAGHRKDGDIEGLPLEFLAPHVKSILDNLVVREGYALERK